MMSELNQMSGRISFFELPYTAICEAILRLAVCGTFLSHGLFALHIKESWIPLVTSFGFSVTAAITLLPIIGLMDILVAVMALVRPVRAVLIWATLWAFVAALSRVTAGLPLAEFFERTANWAAPLVLLLLHGLPKTSGALFRVSG